jgi:DNA polymerase-3 subunit gamma/tau
VPKAPSAPPAAAPRELPDWHAMLGRMRLQGMARQLAHHCELIAVEGESVRLRLANEHQGLAVPSAQDRVQAELSQLLGHSVRLSVESGAVRGETMAQKLSVEQQARRAQALASLEGDDFVQQLIEQFDGELDASSVQPVERT